MESEVSTFNDDLDLRFDRNSGLAKVLVSDGVEDDPTKAFLADNTWPEELPFGWDFTDRRLAARLVFVYEECNPVEKLLAEFNAKIGPTMSKEDRAFYNQIVKDAVEFINDRSFAKHPKMNGYYAFPYILVKFNPETKELGKPIDPNENFRVVIPVRNKNDRFVIRPKTDDHGERIMDWHGTFSGFEYKLEDAGCYRFQIARSMYEMRETLTVPHEFLEYYASAIVDPREIFYTIKQRFLYFVDMPDEWATLSALWVMGTHLFRNFPAYPYIYLLGPQDTGKTRWMKVACQMSHRGRLELNPTGPAIFREVDSTQSTLFIDEVDKIDFQKYPEIRAILNTGYEIGFDVPRVNLDLKMLEHFKTYSPKCLGSNGPIESVLASRMLRIPLQRTPNAKMFVKREPMKPDYMLEFKELHKELMVWSIDQAPAIASYRHDDMEKKWEPVFEELNAPPRLQQILTPLLMLYDVLKLDNDYGTYSPSERQNIKKVVSYLIEESKMSTLPDSDLRVISGLYWACFEPSADSTKGRKPGEAVRITTENIRSNMSLETKKDEEYYTSRKVGRMLDRFSIPRRKSSVMNYLEDKTKAWTHQDQKDYMTEFLKRFNIDPKELAAAKDIDAGAPAERLDTSKYRFEEE